MRDFHFIRTFKVFFLSLSLLISSNVALGQTGVSGKKQSNSGRSDYDLSNLALPSEVKDIAKTAGSIYYSPSIKGKVLIPVHFWGYFTRPGLHFVPVDSSLLEGVSFAGGPNPNAKIDNVRLMRKQGSELKNTFYDLEKGGGNEAAMKKLQPGDMVFVEKDYWYENRSYYTSLIGVVATVLSSILLYRQVKKGQ